MNLPKSSKRILAALALIFVFASGKPAGAEDKKAGDDKGSYTKTTTINFEDDIRRWVHPPRPPGRRRVEAGQP